MRRLQARIPDALTYLRAALVPVLWLLGLLGEERAAGAVLLLAAATDVLDGRLARRWHVTSSVGSRVDALADTGMGLSAAGMLALLEPDVLRDHRLFFMCIGMVAVLLLAWLYRQTGKIADLHILAGRAAGGFAYLFLVFLFLAGWRVEPLLYLFMAASWVLAWETLVAIRTRGRFAGQRSPTLAWLAERRGGGAPAAL